MFVCCTDHAHVGVPFPLLDGERVIYLGCASDFSHYPIITLSNYRFFVAYQDTFYNVSLMRLFPWITSHWC